jgi:hypothetical protein
MYATEFKIQHAIHYTEKVDYNIAKKKKKKHLTALKGVILGKILSFESGDRII